MEFMLLVFFMFSLEAEAEAKAKVGRIIWIGIIIRVIRAVIVWRIVIRGIWRDLLP